MLLAEASEGGRRSPGGSPVALASGSPGKEGRWRSAGLIMRVMKDVDSSTPVGQGADAPLADGFDRRLEKLESIVRHLEEGGLELEPAIESYREGVALLKECRGVLGQYRQQVEELTQEAEAALRPYEADPDVPGADRRG